jgi:hypothetical protein
MAALLLQALEARPVGAPVLVQDAVLVALEILCVVIGALISVQWSRPGCRSGSGHRGELRSLADARCGSRAIGTMMIALLERVGHHAARVLRCR